MPLELTAEEVSSLHPKVQIDGSALTKLLIHYNRSATVYDIASSIEALKVQLERIKENPIGKRLIVLHVSALDRGYEGVRNHYVGLVIERGVGAGGIYQVRYIDPMGRYIDGRIQAIITDKLGIGDIDCYRGRLQYAEEVSTGGVRSFKEGHNDYDCGPILIYLLTKAIYTEELPSLANLEEGAGVRESIRIGKELRDIFLGDNGKRIEDSVDLAEYNGRDRRTIYPSGTAAATAARTSGGGGGGSGGAVVSAAISAAGGAGAGASIRTIDDAGGVRAEAVSEKEAALKKRLRELVLEESTIGLLEEDASKDKEHKKKQEIAQVFLELSRLYLEEVGSEKPKEEESKEAAIKRRANKLNEGVMFANYAISIAEGCIEEVSESVATSKMVGGPDIAAIEGFEAVVKQAYDSIKKIESRLYGIVGAQAPVSMYYRTGRDRAQLERLRQYCRDKLEEVEREYERIKSDRDPRLGDNPYIGSREELYIVSTLTTAAGVTAEEIERREEEERESRITSRSLRLAEEYEIREVRSLYKHIAEETKRLIATIVKESEEVLGPPPCKYSVIGLGSLALNQFTPYSDLEFSILIEDSFDEDRYAAEGELLALSTKRSELLEVEDKVIALEKGKREALQTNERNKEYFRRLSQLIHFRVINLGETVIPKSKVGLPLDQYARRGISFDLGGKTPLGRPDRAKVQSNKPDEPEYELIQTPYGMTRYLDHKKWSGIDKNLPFILEAVVHITGERSITDDYQARVRDYFYAIDPETSTPNHQIKASRRLKEGLDEVDYSGTASPHPESRLTHIKGDIEAFEPKLSSEEDEGRLFDVKKVIYRLPDRLIYGLATYFGIMPKSALDAVEELQKRQVIAVREDVKDAAHHLLRAVTYATSLRLRIYSYYGEQNDVMSVLIDVGIATKKMSSRNPIFRLMPDEFREDGKLSIYYYTAIPLQDVLQKLFNEMAIDNRKSVLANERYYRNNSKTKGIMYKRLLRYENAKEKLEEALEKSPTDLEVMGLLAGVLHKTGKHEQALAYCQRLMKMLKETYGEEAHPAIASTLNTMAVVFHTQGNYTEALSCYEKSLTMKKKIYGEGAHPDVASTLNNMAVLYETQGNHAEAFIYYQESLAMVEEVHPADVSCTLNNMAGLYETHYNYTEALSCYKKSLEMKKKIYGEGAHPDVAGTLNNMANVFKAQGNYIEALRFYEKSLVMKKRIYGEKDHFSIATTFNNMAGLYEVQGNYTEALSCYKKSLEMKKRIYGAKAHHTVAYTLNNIAVVYQLQGNYTEALKYYEESLAIRKEIYGEEGHSSIATILINIAKVYHALNDYTRALKYYQESLTIIEEQESPDIADILSNMAGVHQVQHNYTEALKYYEESLEIKKKIYRVEAHPSVADTLNRMAVVYQLQGNYTEALKCYEESLAIKKKIYGEVEHITIADTLNNMGTLYQDQGNYTEALKCYEESLAIKKKKDRFHPGAARTHYNIASLYDARRDKGDLLKALKASYQSVTMIDKYKQNQLYKLIMSLFNNLVRTLAQQNGFVINHEVIEQLVDLVSVRGADITDYHLQLRFSSGAYITNKPEEALIYQKLARYFAEESEVPIPSKEMISILHDLGSLYHVCGIAKGKYGDADAYFTYLAKAEESFKKALTLLGTETNSGLYTEYANYLIHNDRQDEAIALLKKSILQKVDGKGLTYGKIEEETVDDFIMEEISSNGEVRVRASTYAYYLLGKIYIQQGNHWAEADELITEFIAEVQRENEGCGVAIHNKLVAQILRLRRGREEEAEEFEAIAMSLEGTLYNSSAIAERINTGHEISLITSMSHTATALTFVQKLELPRKPFNEEEVEEKMALLISADGEKGLSKLQKNWRAYIIARREQEVTKGHEAELG
jgi:tetratricopeptide (TPR) repeat protein